jgi:hypothetical protein
MTHVTVGAGLVGFCGETKTAPSGLSAAVTAPAVKGSSIGAPGVSGPDVATGANVEGVAGAVVAEPATVVVVWPDPFDPALGDDGLELHDANSTARAAAMPANCRRRTGLPRIEPQYGVRSARLPCGSW